MPANMHRAPGGVERLDARLLARHAAQQRLPVAGDDEQRVVDADAEPDQQRQLAGERRHVDHMRQQPDDRDACAERDAGGQQRQHHREQRSERHEQDDPGGEEAERHAARATAGLTFGRDLPFELDLDSAARRRCDHRDEPLAAAAETLFDGMSNVTFANATRPDGAIWPAPPGAYGELTIET